MRLFLFYNIHLLVSEIENILLLLAWIRGSSFSDKLVLIVFREILNNLNLINVIYIFGIVVIAPEVNLRSNAFCGFLQRILLQLIEFKLLGDSVEVRGLYKLTEISLTVFNQLDFIK